MSRNRTVLSFAVIVAALALVACGGGSTSTSTSASSSAASPTSSSAAVPDGFRSYTHESPAFSIGYPTPWATTEGVGGAIVTFLAPTTSSSDAFRENVNVLQQTLPSGMTLAQYAKTSIQNAGSVVSDFNVVSQGATTLSGEPAVEVEFTGSAKGKPYRWYAQWMVHDGSAWVLTYTAEPDAYAQYLDDAKATIGSFSLG